MKLALVLVSTLGLVVGACHSNEAGVDSQVNESGSAGSVRPAVTPKSTIQRAGDLLEGQIMDEISDGTVITKEFDQSLLRLDTLNCIGFDHTNAGDVSFPIGEEIYVGTCVVLGGEGAGDDNINVIVAAFDPEVGEVEYSLKTIAREL